MRKIDSPTAVPVRGSIPVGQAPPVPPVNPGWFQEEEPGFSPTEINGWWLNHVQSELINILSEAGLSEHETDETQLAQAIVIISRREAAGGLRDTLLGSLVWVNASQIRMVRGSRGSIFVEIAGSVLELNGSDITFDMAIDLEQAETASAWVYVYLEDVAGVLTPHLSLTPPDPIGSANGGYHPGNVWRCIGAVRNNAASDLVPFRSTPDGGQRPYFGVEITDVSATDWTLAPGTAPGASYVAIDLANVVPAIASEVSFVANIGGNSVRVAYGPERLVGLSNADETAQFLTVTPNTHQATARFPVLIEDPAAPVIAWALTDSGTFNGHAIRITGWR